MSTTSTAAVAALGDLESGDAVLVKGSRVAALERVADALVAAAESAGLMAAHPDSPRRSPGSGGWPRYWCAPPTPHSGRASTPTTSRVGSSPASRWG